MANICDREEMESLFKQRRIIFDEALMDTIAEVYDVLLDDYRQYLWLEYGIHVPKET